MSLDTYWLLIAPGMLLGLSLIAWAGLLVVPKARAAQQLHEHEHELSRAQVQYRDDPRARVERTAAEEERRQLSNDRHQALTRIRNRLHHAKDDEGLTDALFLLALLHEEKTSHVEEDQPQVPQQHDQPR